MATLQEQVEQSVLKYTENADKIHKFVNGTDTETIDTTNGPKPSIAKISKNASDTINSQMTELNNKVQQAENAKTAAENAKEETQNLANNAVINTNQTLNIFKENELKVLNDKLSANSSRLVEISNQFDNLINSFDSNKNTIGFQKLPGGLIYQWGKSPSRVSRHEITYPTTFPNKVFSVVAIVQGEKTNVSLDSSDNALKNNEFLCYTTNNGQDRNAYIRWIAIGY